MPTSSGPVARRSPLKLASVLGLALTLAACSANREAADALAGGAAGAGGGAGRSASPGSPQDFALNVGDRVFFDTDSSDLTPVAVATLDKQAQWLSRYPRYTFLVEGHADERGTRDYNYSLSGRRAQTVREYLGSRGIGVDRLRTVPYGKERPVAVCDDISCWSQNRRSVTVLDAGAGS